MGVDRFCSLITVLNKLKSETINRRTFERLAKNNNEHEADSMFRCYSDMEVCGQCFCETQLRMCFNVFRRVSIFHMSSSGVISLPASDLDCAKVNYRGM